MLPQPRRTPIARRQDPGLPRWVIASLAGLGAVSLIAGSFAVGLVMGRPTAPPDVAWTPAPRPAAEAEFTPPSAPAPNESAGGGSAVPERSDAPHLLPFATPKPDGDEGLGGGDGAAVKAYFAQMDVLAAAVKSAQDPGAMAQTIVAQAASGDMRGLDEILETQRSLEARMAQVEVPPACREHHRRSLDLVRRGISLLERVRSGLATQDMGVLGSLGAEGQALERDAKDVDILGASIRGAAGV